MSIISLQISRRQCGNNLLYGFGSYHYFLGREDQSVNAQVLMKRIDQQILGGRSW